MSPLANPASSELVRRLDELLPQTQCGQCGYVSCRPYAEAMAAGEAINRCPPGGQATVQALAELLRTPALPLAGEPMPPQVAVIREAECIGCTKCIQACPVDAIVGAARLMHTVIAEHCTGCVLCLAPCPVDCIDLIALSEPQAALARQRAGLARERFERRQARLQHQATRQAEERQARLQRQRSDRSLPTPAPAHPSTAAPLKHARIAALRARDQLSKTLRAFGANPDPRQRGILDSLQLAVEQAERQLVVLEQPRMSEHLAPSAGLLALKQAKIALVNQRAALRQAERQQADDATLATLRQALADAEQQLHRAEDASGKRAPQLQRIDKRPISAQLRALKTELAYARADLKKLERNAAPEVRLQAARERLRAAEQALEAAPAE